MCVWRAADGWVKQPHSITEVPIPTDRNLPIWAHRRRMTRCIAPRRTESPACVLEWIEALDTGVHGGVSTSARGKSYLSKRASTCYGNKSMVLFCNHALNLFSVAAARTKHNGHGTSRTRSSRRRPNSRAHHKKCMCPAGQRQKASLPDPKLPKLYWGDPTEDDGRPQAQATWSHMPPLPSCKETFTRKGKVSEDLTEMHISASQGMPRSFL